MTLEEARVRSKQLNAQLFLKRQEELIKEFQEKENNFKLRHDSVLPNEFVAEFELRFVHSRGILSLEEKRKRTVRRFITWRATQRMIVALGKMRLRRAAFSSKLN